MAFSNKWLDTTMLYINLAEQNVENNYIFYDYLDVKLTILDGKQSTKMEKFHGSEYWIYKNVIIKNQKMCQKKFYFKDIFAFQYDNNCIQGYYHT